MIKNGLKAIIHLNERFLLMAFPIHIGGSYEIKPYRAPILNATAINLPKAGKLIETAMGLQLACNALAGVEELGLFNKNKP